MAIPDAWDPESDSGKTKWVEHVEVDDKMQPAPKDMEADLTIKEETLWKTQIALQKWPGPPTIKCLR
ncbi:MAG: hypothetical protein ACREAW_01840 [Nitrososphaera sp.]